MTQREEMQAPVFIVGCGRSGTTALYELLCGHEAFAWFSNYTSRWPRQPQLAALSRFVRMGRSSRWLPRPVEGYRIFDSCRGQDALRPLTEADVSEGERSCLRHVVLGHLRYQGAERFLNKNTRNSRRVRYLNEIFPDALFVHVLRDPRATVASLLNVPWWPDLELWSHDGTTPRRWVDQGGNPSELASEFWNAEVQRILQDAEQLDPAHYLEIRYEDLTSEPRETVDKVLSFLHVPWTATFARFFDEYELSDRNSKIHERLTREQIDLITERTRPLASRYGY